MAVDLVSKFIPFIPVLTRVYKSVWKCLHHGNPSVNLFKKWQWTSQGDGQHQPNGDVLCANKTIQFKGLVSVSSKRHTAWQGSWRVLQGIAGCVPASKLGGERVIVPSEYHTNRTVWGVGKQRVHPLLNLNLETCLPFASHCALGLVVLEIAIGACV